MQKLKIKRQFVKTESSSEFLHYRILIFYIVTPFINRFSLDSFKSFGKDSSIEMSKRQGNFFKYSFLLIGIFFTARD